MTAAEKIYYYDCQRVSILKFSFIHASDIHFGRSFSGLPAFDCDEALKVIKSAEEKIAENIVNIAVSKKVDFVLFAGDTFDDKDKDFYSKILLKRMFERLSENNIKVFAICGNHDPLFSYGKNTFNFDENPNIKIIGLNTQVYGSFPVYNKSEEQICVLHAISYEDETYYGSPFECFSRPNENERNFFNIALAHCDVNGQAEGCYGPCKAADTENLGYDYYALGHIHQPQNFGDKIFYSGTVQGRNIKEKGIHGIRYIEVENRNILKNEFIIADVIRYEHISVDLSGTDDLTSVSDMIYKAAAELLTNKEMTCEVYILNIDLTGFISYCAKFNNEIFDTIARDIYEQSSHKILIGKIFNYTKVKTDEAILNSDTGIIGEIMKIISDDNIMDETFEDVFSSLSAVTYKCEYSPEEISEIQKLIKNETREACLNFCSLVYNKESRR